jgi:radical SAM-linked protein
LKAQRLRFRYRVTAGAGNLGNRDLVSAWEATILQTGLPLSYSEGKRRSPQISLAAPLPLGVTSDCEMADVFLEMPVDPIAALTSLQGCSPGGIEPTSVTEKGVGGPSLQSEITWAEYECLVAAPPPLAELSKRIANLISSRTLISQYVRATKTREYDLRPLIFSLDLVNEKETAILRMRLRAEPDRTARADQVLLALGIDAEGIHRTRLETSEVSEIVVAYRKAGEPIGSRIQ